MTSTRHLSLARTETDACLWSSALAVLFLGTTLSAIFTPEIANAATDQHGGHGSIWDISNYWVNFIVYLLVVYFTSRKAIAAGWHARRVGIQESVNAAAKELKEADTELRNLEKLVANVEFDRQRARDEILRQAEAEAGKMLDDAREKAARIREQTQNMIGAEARAAEQNVRSTLVERAIALATEQFRSGQFKEKQAAYVEAALGRAKRLVQ